MVATISTTTNNPRVPKTPPSNPGARPPLIPSSSDKGNAAGPRRNPTKNISSRFLSSSSSAKQSHSVDRTHNAAPAETPSAAARALYTTTRSLSVSFQGEPFFFQTSKPKPTSPSPARKQTTEPRKPISNSAAGITTARSNGHSEDSKPLNHHQRWPAARTQKQNLLTRSLDFSVELKVPVLAAIKLLPRSIVFEEETIRNGSDSDSVSSGSSSGLQENKVPTRARATPRGIIVPARFLQETHSRVTRLPESGTPVPSPSSKTAGSPKLVTPKKSMVDSQLPYPRSASSPCKLATSPSRGMASPSLDRSSSLAGIPSVDQSGTAPSIVSFAAEARRRRKGESRIEEAHLLRLFFNRYLQWRFINARASTSLQAQKLAAEKDLYGTWISTSGLRDSVTAKTINLRLLTQSLKLTSILEEQMTYLEEWSLMDRDHLSSLSGVIEAMKASTLRLPVVGGARADIQEVKDAVGSAVDVMQAMLTSASSSLAKVEGMSSLVSELAEVAGQERALLEQSRSLLSMAAAMHVKHCSLQGHILQLNRKSSLMQL